MAQLPPFVPGVSTPPDGGESKNPLSILSRLLDSRPEQADVEFQKGIESFRRAARLDPRRQPLVETIMRMIFEGKGRDGNDDVRGGDGTGAAGPMPGSIIKVKPPQ